MTKKISKIMFFMILSLMLISFGFAQRHSGTVAGKVIDDEGTPLPGVTVSISGPNLQGIVDYITSDAGNYRFPSLPPGDYTLTCTLNGFKTFSRSGIIVHVAKTTTINAEMEPSTIEETITVTAASPSVDVTSSKIGVTFTQEMVTNVPVNRGLNAIIMSAPGAVRDQVNTSFMSTHGADVSSNIYQLDGLNIEDPLMRQLMTDIDLNMAEEIEIQTGGKAAEIGSAAGAYVNIVTRSGGNALTGVFESQFFTNSFAGSNVTPEQLDAVGLPGNPEDDHQYDLSFNLGGPIVKDKLWFFVAGRYLDLKAQFIGLDQEYTRKQYYGMGKLTFRLSKNLKLMSYFNYRYTVVPINASRTSDLSRVELEAIAANHLKYPNVNIQLNWVASQNAFLDVRAMYIRRWYDFVQQEGATHRNQDLGTGVQSGGQNYNQDLAQLRFLTNASFTLFVDDFLGGSHEFKFGGEYERAGFDHATFDPWPLSTFTLFGSPYAYGGNSGFFRAFGVAAAAEDTTGANWRTITSAFYAQDSWTIGQRLTLNLGLRFDSTHAEIPDQIQPRADYWMWLDPVFFAEKSYTKQDDFLKWNTISPRLGVVYDIFGTGKTVVKASFSRYRDYLQLGYFYFLNANSPYSYRQYTWVDNNMNGEIDPADTNTLVFSSGRGDLNAKERVDPNVKAPFYNEYVVGLDHELLDNFRIGVSFISKNHMDIYEGVERNNVENWAQQISVSEPGYDGVFGTEDDSVLNMWDRTRPQEQLVFTNPDELFRKYNALEFVAAKRWSNNWQLIGSVVWSKAWGTIGNQYAQSVGAWEGIADNPNYYLNREGRLNTDRPIIIKLQGSFLAPADILVSFNYLGQSGGAYARTLQVFTPGNGAYTTVNAEPQGTRRYPFFNNLDLRVEKTFTFGNAARFGVYLELANALNSTYFGVSSQNQGRIQPDGSFLENARWLDVTSVNFPRMLRIGLRFTF